MRVNYIILKTYSLWVEMCSKIDLEYKLGGPRPPSNVSKVNFLFLLCFDGLTWEKVVSKSKVWHEEFSRFLASTLEILGKSETSPVSAASRWKEELCEPRVKLGLAKGHMVGKGLPSLGEVSVKSHTKVRPPFLIFGNTKYISPVVVPHKSHWPWVHILHNVRRVL